MSGEVWITTGSPGHSVGFRWSRAGLEQNLAEWEARFLAPGDRYAIHDGACELGRVDGRVCSCEPEMRTVIRPA